MAESTPRPWRSEGPDPFGDYTIVQEDGGLAGSFAIAAVVSNLRDEDEVAANAEVIVRAVNSHDELLEAAKTVADVLKVEQLKTQVRTDVEEAQAEYEAFAALYSAIAKAEGKHD